MAVESSSDRAVLLADFGESISIDGVAVTAIYDEGGAVVALGDAEAGVAVLRPGLLMAASDAETVHEGSSVTIGTQGYRVAEAPSFDGTGFVQIHLEKM